MVKFAPKQFFKGFLGKYSFFRKNCWIRKYSPFNLWWPLTGRIVTQQLWYKVKVEGANPYFYVLKYWRTSCARDFLYIWVDLWKNDLFRKTKFFALKLKTYIMESKMLIFRFWWKLFLHASDNHFNQGWRTD